MSRQSPHRARLLLSTFVALSCSVAAQIPAPYASIKPILDSIPQLPQGLIKGNEASWNTWRQKTDRDIRARLDQGDLDTMVNLLLFGTSFTTRPRMQVETLADAARSGLLRGRVDDMVAHLRMPSDERLSYLRDVLAKQNVDPDNPQAAGKLILDNLQRVLQEKVTFAQRVEAAKSTSNANPAKPADAFSESSNLFQDRGISLDTTILPNFGVEAALADMQKRGVLKPGSITRVAIIGPGLDFVDKESGFDYYPLQTLQPFAVYDSLRRLGLSPSTATNKTGVRMTIFDISGQVLQHIAKSRNRANSKAAKPYDLQLPRDPARNLTPAAIAYWNKFGSEIGSPIDPIKPSGAISTIQTRAIRIRPEVVLSLQPVDLNIVTQRMNLPASDKFDLIIATNMFVYYNPFEQALAMQNVAAMLKPTGLLLTNDELTELPALSLHKQGSYTLLYTDGPTKVGDTMLWYGTH